LTLADLGLAQQAEIFEIFAHIQRHELRDQSGTQVQVFEPELTPQQLKILELLDIPTTAYTRTVTLPAAAR
jgi:hypothetical protein